MEKIIYIYSVLVLFSAFPLQSQITFQYEGAGNLIQKGKADNQEQQLLQTLTVLYQSTAGDNWLDKEGWLSDCDYCEWSGVTCNIQREIIALELANNNLSGNFPAIISQLSTLEVLDLSNNNLVGIIGDISNLTALHTLKLNHNQLTSELPPNWCNLTNLTTLYLQNNQLSGCYPECFNAFCTLDTDFSQNADLPDFTTFCADNAQSCPCTPTHQSEYDALVALYEGTDGDNWEDNNNWLADCDYCNWEGITCGGMGRVTIVNLSSNNLVGDFPTELGNLPQLQQLRLRSNQLTGMITFTNPLLNLYRLDLTNNSFSGNLPDLLPITPNVSLLYLSGNNFTGSIPESFCSFDFSVLYLDRNDLSGCLPACLSNFCNANVRMANNPQLPDGGNFSAFCQQQTGACVCISDYSAANGNRLTGIQQTSKTFSSEYIIESNQTIAATADVVYTAGESIILEAGFNVEAGATFTATIGGCTNTNLQSDTIQTRFANTGNISDAKPLASCHLGQNYPNPFQANTSIPYQLSGQFEQAKIQIFDYLGRSVWIQHLSLKEGVVQLDFPKKNVGGIYFYSLVIDGKMVAIKRMVVGESY